ncbi:lysophospholipid acyltransferase family protein [Litorivivens sp.]|uniref:lysophospholipid acyltransferase family protein n=1 Tax=Litorivivens sp. TaxID=2020868 RepID=UPI00356155E0
MARRKRPLTTSQKVARKILQGFFEFCFASMSSLRFSASIRPEKPSVIAVFHDEMVAATGLFAGQPVASIASLNHNGYAVAQVIARRAGFEMVYGSTSKGGREAFYELNDALSRGKSVIFTVDGSRGPRHEMKPGAIMLAKKNRVPLYLLRCRSSGLRLPTWDRFLIPLPFARVRVEHQLIDFSSGEEKRAIKDLLPHCNEQLRQMGQ